MSGVLALSASPDRVPRSCVIEHRSVCNMTGSAKLSVGLVSAYAVEAREYRRIVT
jgi:hypothetical protein